MADLIKREDVLDKIEHLRDKCGNDEMAFALNWASGLIRDIQAVDAVEVKHGYWNRVHDDVCYWSECSKCGERQPLHQWRQEYESAFCPGCGARMDGRREEERDADVHEDYADSDGYIWDSIWGYSREAIKNAPTVDAVPVVRCAKCRFSKQ